MEIIEEECESEKENIDVDESLCRIEETRPPATTSIGVQTEGSAHMVELECMYLPWKWKHRQGCVKL